MFTSTFQVKFTVPQLGSQRLHRVEPILSRGLPLLIVRSHYPTPSFALVGAHEGCYSLPRRTVDLVGSRSSRPTPSVCDSTDPKETPFRPPSPVKPVEKPFDILFYVKSCVPQTSLSRRWVRGSESSPWVLTYNIRSHTQVSLLNL